MHGHLSDIDEHRDVQCDVRCESLAFRDTDDQIETSVDGNPVDEIDSDRIYLAFNFGFLKGTALADVVELTLLIRVPCALWCPGLVICSAMDVQ